MEMIINLKKQQHFLLKQNLDTNLDPDLVQNLTINMKN